jgi:nucleoside-diphosphate kinase
MVRRLIPAGHEVVAYNRTPEKTKEIEGEGAIATCRTTIGATNPADADPGSLRGDLALSMPNNLVHGSDSAESAEREIGIWFPDGLA